MIKDSREWCLNAQGEYVHPDMVKVDEKLKDEMVDEIINKALVVSNDIKELKKVAYEKVESYFDLLMQEYGIDGKKGSKKGNMTLENFSRTAKIQIAIADNITFDEKLQVAKIKIDEYLNEITKDSSADIQTLINRAFEVDKKGEINTRKILELKSANITNTKWVEAMKIIEDSIKVVSTKSYVRFYTRESIDKDYKLVPLDIAGV